MAKRKQFLTDIIVVVGALLVLTVSPALATGTDNVAQLFYVRKSTWQETMMASRARLPDFIAGQPEAVQAVRFGCWYTTGALSSDGFSDELFPEKRVELDTVDAVGKAVWRKRLDWRDGRVHELGDDNPCATYLFRTITTAREVTITAGLGSNDGLELWLNGRKILSNNVNRWAVCHDDQVILDLAAGRNELLLKVFNGTGTSAFCFSVPGHAVRLLWECVEQDFPVEAAWMKGDIAPDDCLSWFEAPDKTTVEQRIISRVLDGMGRTGDTIRKEFEMLRRERAAADDQRWLNLYIEACKHREVQESLEPFNIRALRRAVAYLYRSFPNSYRKGAEYLDRLDYYEQRMLANQSMHDRDDETAKQQRRVLAREFRSFQHKVLVEENPLLDFDRLLFVKRYTYNSDHYYTDFINGSQNFGGNICILSLSDGNVTELLPQMRNGIFGRFDLSFDGSHIVFDYKEAIGKGYRIHEVGTDGAGLRQLTFPPHDEAERIKKYKHDRMYHHHTDDLQPCYLPDGGICFISTRCEYGILCNPDDILTTTVLYRMDADGGDITKLTNSSVSEASPSVMNDGRILYTRWEYVDKGQIGVKCLWAMRPDGSGTVEVFGNDIPLPPSLLHGRAIENHNNMFVVLGAPHYPQSGVGTVIRLDVNHPIRTRRPMTYITPHIDIRGEGGFAHYRNGSWEGDHEGPLFMDPYPLNDKFFLVSHNPDRPWNDIKAYGLYLLDEFGNCVPIYRDTDISCWQPYPLRRRTRPPIVPSILDADSDAEVLLSSVYEGLDDVEAGTIEYLRITEQVPRPWSARRFWEGDSAGGQHVALSLRSVLGLKVLHGVVPVHEDGSAYFTVPANKNIYFQALDENFMEIQRMRTYINLRPGEKRSCVGCHRLRRLAPPSRAAAALNRPATKPRAQPGDIAPRPIHYPSDVQPILDRYCIRCHSGNSPAAKLDLSGEMTALFSRSYENIIERRLVKTFNEGSDFAGIEAVPPKTVGSHASKLIAKLRHGHHEVELSRAEFIKLATWVDANAQYYGSYYGRRNLKYKDHPNFRPVPTFASASGVQPIADKDR